MKTNNSASYEARLKNNKDLIEKIKTLSKYTPTAADIKAEKYEEFILTVESNILPYKNKAAELTTAQTENHPLIKEMTYLSRSVRSEIAEIKGEDSDHYRNVNSVVKLITGQNVQEHAKHIQEITLNKKEGDPESEFSSVSQLDFKSKVGNFKSLIALLKTYEFYSPDDETITIDKLEAKEAEVSASLLKLAGKEAGFVNSRSALLDLFDKKGGLRDRAKRARLHVKRKYGITSPEYKSLVNKNY